MRWWFVVRGDERVLKDLESNWGSVSIQTAWKLEPVMEFEATMSPTPQKQHTIPSDKRSEDLQASANMHTSETRVATKDILGSVAAVDPTHTDPHTETSSPLRSIPSQANNQPTVPNQSVPSSLSSAEQSSTVSQHSSDASLLPNATEAQSDSN